MKTVLSAIYATLMSVNPVFAATLVPLLAVTAFFTWLNSQLGVLILKMDALTASSFAGGLNVSPFSLVNTFVPLQEAMTMFTAWVSVFVLATVIRWVKAFVPTIAS